ncbi:chorismate mutase type II [Fusarium pseudocircinatum]|uniref:Chorismate mutase type II n=1 Tax=Fusarium pseudocircinatum TaxID=56676 RepID=A0A8H5Q0V7_9HYPO|nr:chorismate mutase type II [Fusarium pseudocircinatum]
MHSTSPLYIGLSLCIAAATGSCHPSSAKLTRCIEKPSINATADNYPGSASSAHSTTYPYNVSCLNDVPVAASACKSTDPDEALACARKFIDAIDEQISFLYARRLGYAAVAGAAKFNNGTALNDPTRNQAVAAGMAARVLKYGGSEETGRIMGGEGCQIYASLEYEAQQIQNCGGKLNETFETVCK